MRRLTRTILGILGGVACMLVTMSLPSVALADTAEGTIEVSATDPCAVRLVGVSDNTKGYDEQVTVNGKASFTVVAEEPGDYEYEMRQIQSQGMEPYDPTVYHVWVTAYYEGDTLQTAVTGGITGTDDKPEAFTFSKPKQPEQESPKQTPGEATTTIKSLSEIVQMGDRRMLAALAVLFAGLVLFALTGAFGKRGGRR